MSTTAKLVHLSTERRRRNYVPPDPLKVQLLESHVSESLATVSRLCWEDDEVARKLIEASTIGGAAC